ncbi:hypothetical protein D3C74_452960 [compost metagenome]
MLRKKVGSLIKITIIGAIAGGGAAALAAIQVVTKFNDCKDDVSDAYLYISQF